MSWRHGGYSQNWDQWQSPGGRGQRPKARREKEKEAKERKEKTGKDKDDKQPGFFPSYESISQQASSSSASTGAKGADIVQDAQNLISMMAAAAEKKGVSLPASMKRHLPSDTEVTRETIRNQQKDLNKLRSLTTKVTNKQNAIEKEEEQWNLWMTKLKDYVKTERGKHHEKQDKLHKELKRVSARAARLSKQDGCAGAGFIPWKIL